MKRSELFLLACNTNNALYAKRDWLISVFYGQDIGSERIDKPLYPYLSSTGWVVRGLDGNDVPITDANINNEPLYTVTEYFDLPKGAFSNVEKPYRTTYGVALANLLIFVRPFASLIPYQNKPFDPGDLDQMIEDKLRNKEIPLDGLLKLYAGTNFMYSLAKATVPSITYNAVSKPVDALRIRDELLEKHKHELHIPAVAAMIDQEITRALKEKLEGDEINEFLSKKSYNVVLKSLLVSRGGTEKFGNPSEVDYLSSSLMEGVKPEDLPIMANKLRSGSNDRGSSTALGGYLAKILARMFANITIAESDCLRTVGLRVTMNKHTHREYVGRYIVGQKKPITDTAQYIGKEIIIRSPRACQTANGNLCRVCMGDVVADAERGLVSMASGVGSVFLSVFLAAFHGTALETEPLDLDTWLT